jgi:hypothetical protein
MAGGGAVEHSTVVVRAVDKCTMQVFCECGWRSGVFGADEDAARMDALYQATEVQDLHLWDAELP